MERVFTAFDDARDWIARNEGYTLGLLIGAVVVVASVELVADYFLKKWSHEHRKVGYLVGGMLVYCLVGCLYGVSLLLGDLTIANSIWQVLSVVSVTFLGVVVFSERPSPVQWTGILVITAGLVTMLLGSPGLLPPSRLNRPWGFPWEISAPT